MKRLLLLIVLGAVGCGGGSSGRTEEDRIDDHAIESDVSRVLTRVPGVDRLRIRIESTGGRVTLSGSVPGEEGAKAACEAARKVDGVVEVIDRLVREDAAK